MADKSRIIFQLNLRKEIVGMVEVFKVETYEMYV